jgi:large subunit ribosomal protein L14e
MAEVKGKDEGMAIMDIGRVCVKTAGREAGRKVAVVDVEKEFVVIEGVNVRRRRCSTAHLFPTKEKIGIKKGAKHEEIVRLLKHVK